MPLSASTRNPPPCEKEQYRAGVPDKLRIGIALSGGGIRSAAFNLGALQSLQDEGVLRSAAYLTAVSGGNYVASALTISAARFTPEHENGKALWAHGSAEELRLRQSTDYLAPGRVGRVWLALSVVYGFVLNYLPFLLGAFVVGRLTGWLLYSLGLKLADLRLNGFALPSSPVLQGMLILLGSSLLLALTLVAVRRFRDGYSATRNYGTTRSEPNAARLVLAAAVIGIGLVLPALAAEYAALSRWVLSAVFAEPADTFDTVRGRFEIAAVWLAVTLVVAAVALALSRRLRARRLMLGLSSLAGAGLLLVPLLSSLEHAVRHGVQSFWDVGGAVAALAGMVVMAVAVNNRRYSLHLFYRERLNSAFALRRTEAASGNVVAEPIPYNEKLTFSTIGAALPNSAAGHLPKLIVCCAVNLTTDEVPSGRFAESFTFEHDVSGGPLFGYHPTTCFEAAGGPSGTQLTLPSIMAVSGAALSPLMGRFTYPPVRFLMALTNVRLGVWIPNPRYENRKESPPDRTGWRRPWEWIKRGWFEPGALYVLREALGTLRSNRRYIYLTDGGHWENLGLVELLRRRCTHVLCFDASSDRTGDGQDIGRAIAMARSELGAEVTLDPRPTMATATQPASDLAVLGAIRYPDGQDEAKIVYAKAALTEQASWDLHAFRARDGLFPHHPTSQQIFTDEQFEAYRSLGYAAGRRAFTLINLPPALMEADGVPTNGRVGAAGAPS